MSFSSVVKEEISRQLSGNGHCLKAELAAVITMAGQVLAKGNNEYEIYLYTENLPLARKFFYLIRKAFGLVAELRVRSGRQSGSRISLLAVRDKEAAYRILKACRVTFAIREWEKDSAPEVSSSSSSSMRSSPGRRE